MLVLLINRQPWNPSSLKIGPLHTTLKVSHSSCLPRMIAKVNQGEGECNQELDSTKTTKEPTPQAETRSYAPQGLLHRHEKLQKKSSHIPTLETPLAKGAVARIHNTCSVRHRESSPDRSLCLQYPPTDSCSQSAELDRECTLPGTIPIYHSRISAAQ